MQIYRSELVTFTAQTVEESTAVPHELSHVSSDVHTIEDIPKAASRFVVLCLHEVAAVAGDRFKSYWPGKPCLRFGKCRVGRPEHHGRCFRFHRIRVRERRLTCGLRMETVRLGIEAAEGFKT